MQTTHIITNGLPNYYSSLLLLLERLIVVNCDILSSCNGVTVSFSKDLCVLMRSVKTFRRQAFEGINQQQVQRKVGNT